MKKLVILLFVLYSSFFINFCSAQINSVTASATANVSCNGGNNGDALAIVSGGITPYTYSWSTGSTTVISIANPTGSILSAGTYTVTVTDNTGSSLTASVIITQPALLSASENTTNVSCNGGNNGSASSIVTGGTSPYTYTWSPIGGTNATRTGLTAGTYTVTITDKNGCNSTASVNITQPSALTATISNSKGACNGSNNAYATVTVSGGTSPYTYSWSPSGGNNPTASNLAAGTYTITVNDHNSCAATATVTLNQSSVITISVSTGTNGMCNGDYATVSAVGGTTPYTYFWSPGGQTTASISNLASGTYVPTVTDLNGCTNSNSGSITLTGLSNPSVSISAMNVSCNGGSNGSATATATGGVTPYTYSWMPGGETTATKSNLSAGTYTVTVTANTGCSGTASIIITQPGILNGIASTVNNVSCYGGNNGSVTLNTSGGTSPYTYSWSPIGGTNATGTGLTVGTYTITITDINNCSPTGSIKVIVTQPAAPVSPTISANPGVSCYGGTTTATLSISGGTSPYTYSWSPIGGTNSTGTGLIVGTYTITIKDINGCTPTAANTTVVVTQPAAPVNPTISANPGVSCYGGTTTATLSISGGTSPYTYSWSPIGGTNATGTGLTVGTYTVTIKDINGCAPTAANTTVVVTQPAAPVSPTISANPGVSCYGGTTTATITTSGGTSPYTYSWSPIGGTNATGTGLTVGTYNITIKDINGCAPTAATTTVVVTQPAAPVSPTISANPGVSCYGGTTTATLSISGGTSPYTYSWSPIGGTNATGTGLTVGTYTITIKDINGCAPTAANTTVVVTQPAAPVSPTISANPGVSCYGGTTTATLSISGGTSPYTYSWSPIGGTNATGTGLTVGTYTITIKDINGCTPTAATTTVVVTQPAAPVSPTISANPGVSCYGATTTATLSISGGTSPYTYSWSPIGGTNATGTGLTVGTYTITITDKNGCTPTAANTTVVVTQPVAPVNPTISANPGVSCYGATTTATLSISGGTSPYTYLWSPIGGTNATGTGLTVGTYTITIKDINGCTPTAANTTVVVTQPAAPVSPTISANPGVSCYGGTTTATITTSGGTSPYTYSWSPIGGTNATGTGLTVGTYTITIKDINGCTPTAANTTVVVTQPAAPVSPTISANPGVSCYGATTTATLSISGGTSPYTYSWSPIGGTNATGTGLTVGTYTITITDASGCTPTAASTTVVVTQPAAPVSPTISANPGVSCYGATTTAMLSISGGTSPYTYSWSPIGGTNATGTGLTVGTYTVTIKDINGCTPTAANTTVVVTQPAAPVSPTISANPGVSCYGATTTATLSITGGTSPYTYLWSPIGGTNATGTGLTVGTYTITIKDINGCTPTTANTTVVVTQPTAPVSPTISANPGVSCYGGTTTATLSISGGTSPYTYSWSPIGGTNATGTGLTVGTYTITIKDINGCTPTAANTTVVVTQPAAPVSPTISANPGVSCYGGTTTATLSISGGTSPYTYSWSPIGGTNATGTGLTVGTYTITIKDINGCAPTAANTIVVVTQPAAPVSPTISANPGVSCFGATTTVTITTSGGTSPYTYLWSPIGGTNATGTGLTVGTYTITIKDINGCTPTAANTTVVVIQPAAPVSPTISANPGVSCYGATTTATLSISGGTSPYTYSWSPIGGTNSTGTGLTVGTYTITIKDINGCTPTAANTTVVVTQPAAPVSPTISANPGVSCYGATTTATITTSGGTSPYTYSWSPIGGTNSTGTGLTVGTYTITIKDINGCTATSGATTVIVTQPAAPVSPTISANPGVSCYGGTTTATLSISGGTSPYTYSWSPIGGTNATGTGLTVGTYTVTIKDINGCTATSGATTVIVTQPAAPVSPTISANPGVSCYGGTTTATITTSGGTSPYTYSWSPIGGTNATGTGLTVGTYTVTIKDINGCTATSGATTIIVTQPAAPVNPTISANPGVSCYGGTTTATITTSGGTSPYTYSWSPIGGTNATGTGLTAGTYTVTVKDANGCSPSSITTIIITQPAPIASSAMTSLGIACNGGTEDITLTTSGGTSPYTYLWSPIGGTNAKGTGLTAGTYTVYITDNNGCTGTATTAIVIVTQPSILMASANTSTPISCNGGIGTAIVSPSGGTSPYTYSWSPIGGTNATGTGLTAGTYTIIVSDNNHCSPTSSIVTVVITQPNAINAIITSTSPNACIGQTLMLSASGATTYLWSNGSTSSSINVLIQAGDTAYWVIGMNGVCSDTSAITKIKLFKPAMTACCNTKILLGEDTIISAFGTDMTYQWNDPNNSLNYDTGATVIATPTITTTYTVTGTNIQGCAVDTTITIEIEIPCFGNLTIPNVFTPTNAGTFGLDNKFYIKTENLDSWSIIIYDRWGVQVYNSTNPFQYWDGNTLNGNTSPAGVYYYILNASCQGHTYKKDGYVQLIR